MGQTNEMKGRCNSSELAGAHPLVKQRVKENWLSYYQKPHTDKFFAKCNNPLEESYFDIVVSLVDIYGCANIICLNISLT